MTSDIVLDALRGVIDPDLGRNIVALGFVKNLVIDGGVPIRDLNRVMDWGLPDEEATTVAGLVIHEARTIPEPGQTFVFHGFRFEVLRKTRNRITQLRISSLPRA